MFNLFLLFCLSCVILSCVEQNMGFQCFLNSQRKQSESITPPTIHKNEEKSYHLPQTVCDYSNFYTINPYRENLQHLATRNPFSSVCLRCAACLAVAQEVNKTVHKIKIGEKDPQQEVKMIEDMVKSLCTNGFGKFDLRSYKGYTIVTKASPSTSHVSSNMDGRWQSKLRELCSIYFEHTNMLTFYNRLLKRPFIIADYLCRGDGVLRDCSNVNFKTIDVLKEKPLEPNILFTLECLISNT